MSYSVNVDIHCDDCGDWFTAATSHKVALLALARRVAKSAGWMRQDGRDICPTCQAKGKFKLQD